MLCFDEPVGENKLIPADFFLVTDFVVNFDWWGFVCIRSDFPYNSIFHLVDKTDC